MNKEKGRVPKLRFPGFTEDWEQRKLNDFVTIRRGLTYKPSDIAENGIRVLRSSNIDEDQFITSNDDVFVNIEAVNIPFAKNGDILITSANGSNRLVGKHTIISDIADNSTVHGGFMLLAESNNPLFTDALLSSNWYKRFINTYVAGGNGAIGNLSKSDLESQTVMVPSEHEQAKIGQWYDNINQLITLHQRKLEHLNLKKKALLQKLFPKNGERYPELRFLGFTDAWEQRKFGEIYERAGQKNDLTYGIDKIISVANMYFKKDVIVGSEEYLKTYNVFKLGDIAFEGHTNKEYRYGRFVENTIGDGIVSHIFDVFTPKINLDINFWKDLIKYEPIMGPILRRCTKASRMMSNLTTKEFLEEQILCPTLEEQKFIGEFIVSLDKNITLHQRKLEHLQLQKKALLQQMFV